MATTPNPSPEFSQALAALADRDGFIELPDFIETALYHPTLGYYQKPRARVGRQQRTDFFTASSLRSAFAAIVSEAAAGLAKAAGLRPGELDWVEIGAEPGEALLDGAAHATGGFRSRDAIRLGEPIRLEGELAVFSNELFDAQPFRQLRFVQGRWTEFGVRVHRDSLQWQARRELSKEAQAWRECLPNRPIEGYTIDLPTGALSLARRIAEANWRGVFIAFDYGKTWSSLTQETPQGTARSYAGHQLFPDILAAPGDRDITCHICWDHLEQALSNAGFQRISLESQEAFIVHRAPDFLKRAFDPRRSALDPLRTQLKELMHPSLMGQKFQVLSATRS